jgi:hypothetical protein
VKTHTPRIRRSLYWILEEPDARWDLGNSEIGVFVEYFSTYFDLNIDDILIHIGKILVSIGKILRY